MFKKYNTVNNADENTIKYDQNIFKQMYDFKRESRENDEQVKYFMERGAEIDKSYLKHVKAQFYKIEILLDLKYKCSIKGNQISMAFIGALDKLIEDYHEGKDFTNKDVKTLEKILKALGLYDIEESYSDTLGARFYKGGKKNV